MKCLHVREELTAYLGGELIEAKKNALEAHLENCASCARELVRVKKLEQELKMGLEAWMDGGSNAEQEGSLGEWLLQQSRKMSEREIEEKRAWVSGLGDGVAGAAEKKVSQKKPWQRMRVAVAAVLAVFMLVTYWPQAVRASTYMPILGPWVQKLVLKDAGLNWAYENGYIKENLASAESDGVKLTILGAVADPVHTTVIYLVDGMHVDYPYATISAVNGEGVASWSDRGSDTPLGKVGIAQTRALPAGENTLTVTLMKGGNLNQELEVKITLDREEISRLSQSIDLDYEQTVDGITVRANRVVYTPTQVMVDYSVSGGSTLQGTSRPEHGIYLLAADGQQYNSVMGGGSYKDEQWELQQVFNHPQKKGPLTMVIPALGRYVDVNLEFTPKDLNTEKEVLGTKLMLTGWQGRLDVTVQYPAVGRIQELRNWYVKDAAGKKYETFRDGQSWSPAAGELFKSVTDRLQIEEGVIPVSAIAQEVQLIIEGNWQLALPPEN